MSDPLLIVADLAAVTLLVYGIYYPRHRRREMVLAYLGLNVGVLAVTTVLISSPVTVGLGMGLFGVLSLIRLRSDELSHEEVAYYFCALALGLVFGLTPDPLWISPAMAALLLLVMVVVDRGPFLERTRHEMLTLDAVVTDEVALRARLENLLGAEITAMTVRTTDLVRDSMLIDVRYRLMSRVPVGQRR